MKANTMLDIRTDTKQLRVPTMVLALTPGSFLSPYLVPSMPFYIMNGITNESPIVRKETPHVAK